MAGYQNTDEKNSLGNLFSKWMHMLILEKK